MRDALAIVLTPCVKFYLDTKTVWYLANRRHQAKHQLNGRRLVFKFVWTPLVFYDFRIFNKK